MLGKKHLNNTRRAALILEARAGLIPASDDIADEARARIDRTSRIGRIVGANAKMLTRGSEALAISDILADLRHYCDGKGLSFSELDSEACEHYEDEASQSRMVDPLSN